MDGSNREKQLLEHVLAQTDRLERSLLAPPRKAREIEWRQAWRIVRRSVERLYEAFLSPVSAAGLPPEKAEELRHLQSKSLELKAAQRELELRTAGTDTEWAGLIHQLGQLHDDWNHLIQQLGQRDAALNDADLEERLTLIESLWTKMLWEDASALRERRTLSALWRRIMATVVPRLDKPDSPAAAALIARRLRDMDRLWRSTQAKAQRNVADEHALALRSELSQAQERAQRLSADLLASIQDKPATEELEALHQKLQSMYATLEEGLGQRRMLEGQLELIQSEKDSIEKEYRRIGSELAERTQFVKRFEASNAALRQELEEWKTRSRRYDASLEMSKSHLASGQAALQSAKLELSAIKNDYTASQAKLAATTVENSALKAELQASQNRVANAEQAAAAAQQQAATLQSQSDTLRATLHGVSAEREQTAAEVKNLQQVLGDLQAARPIDAPEPQGLPMPVELQSMPSIEPVLEPGLSKVVALIRQPLTSAFTQLRRLAASQLTQGQRAVVKLAAGALAQGQDVMTVLAEFLEESPAPAVDGRLEPLVTAAFGSWEGAFRAKGVTILRKMEAVETVRFNQQAVRVALYQLIRNAYEATPRGGNVTVRLWQEAPGGMVCVSLIDTGPGFTAEARQKLFEPFASARPGHLGLGLALARRTAQRLGGEIEVGQAARGALVTMKLPSAVPPPPTLHEGKL